MGRAMPLFAAVGGKRKTRSAVQPKLIETLTGQTRPLCVDCGEPFVRGEEEVAARRGTGMPVSARCPACRIARREAWNAHVLETLRTGDLRGVQPATVGPTDGSERLYSAICSGCQRPIRLPFKPRLDRPVYCRFCLDARNGR
jgi:CxxC-x17-CxxC domain-containing protein